MKKTYKTPQLTNHGTIDDITKFFGSASAVDTIYVGTASYGYGTGSVDGVIVPKP